MNKFATIAILLACVAACSALTQDEHDREIGLLMGHEKVFSQFCISSMVHVKSDMTKRANDKTSSVFLALFGATADIAEEVMNVEKDAVSALAAEIASPSQQVSSEPLPEDKVLALIEEGKRDIQQRGLFGRFVAASKSAGSVLVNAANSAVFVRLAKLRTIFDAATLVSAIKNTCEVAKLYEEQLEANLSAAQASLIAENQEPEVQQFIQGANLRSLKCFTPRTVTRVNGFCELLKNGAGAFMKMLGLNSSKINFSDSNEI